MKIRFGLLLFAAIAVLPCGIPSNAVCAQNASDSSEYEKPKVSINQPLTDEERNTPLDEFVSPEQLALNAFDPPPDSKQIGKRNLWIDREKSRVYVDGYIAMNAGPLEMFACPAGTKEHESIVATMAAAKEVHAALLAVGAQPGTPVRFLPEFVPATGQRIRVWVCYHDKGGKFHVLDAREWIKNTESDKQMDVDWVFAGSGIWEDPVDGRKFYRADSGDMICVSNFTTAMMDVPVASSAEASQLQYS